MLRDVEILQVFLVSLNASLAVTGWILAWSLHRAIRSRLSKLDEYTPREILRRVESLETSWEATHEQVKRAMNALHARAYRARKRSEDGEGDPSANTDPTPAVPTLLNPAADAPYGVDYLTKVRELRSRGLL